MTGSIRRVGAMTLRYCYLLRTSWPRLLELVYWPAMQMLVWGFLQIFLSGEPSSLAKVSGTFVGAVLLWDVLYRGQLGFSISFLEEMWSRNIGNLMISPLRPLELAASLMVISIVRLLIGLVPVTLFALLFFGFNVYSLGFGLVALFISLILTSWAIGLAICGLVLRHGMGAESLAWSLVIMLLPVCCVYYPVWVLPHWLQTVAWFLAPTYVFEALRSVIINHVFRWDLFAWSLALNAVYLTFGLFTFFGSLRGARRTGALCANGE
jgi:ABC-2 type transport system permease protein